MRVLLQFLAIIIILVIASAFAALNDQVLNLNYFLGYVDTHLNFVIIISFILGALFSLALLSVTILQGRLERRRLRKALELRNQELTNLRELPTKEDFNA